MDQVAREAAGRRKVRVREEEMARKEAAPSQEETAGQETASEAGLWSGSPELGGEFSHNCFFFFYNSD